MNFVLKINGTCKFVSGDGKEQPSDVHGSKYEQHRDLALADILLFASDDFSALLIDIETPKEVWDALKAQFDAASSAAIEYLHRRVPGDQDGA